MNTRRLGLVATFLMLAAQAPAFGMNIYLSGKHILSNDYADIEVFDRVCNRSVGVYRVHGNALVPVSVCANSSGHGDIARRNLTNNQTRWDGAAFLRENEHVYP